VLIFGTFLIAGVANPSPDPITMLILGGDPLDAGKK